ncbi:MAG: hypothetical protein JXB62_23465 [Pirellulales bacterium]|nr:hypothetical protein [Pirellulales bacterium]
MSTTATRTAPARGAFSLLEVSIASVLVGLVLVVAMQTLGSAMARKLDNGNAGRASLLAHALLAEIVELGYLEPDDTPVFGPEVGETSSGTRTAYDDVDDYHGWSCQPPTAKDGTELPDLDDWQRTVSVQYVDPDDLDAAVGGDQGIKMITVSVAHDGTTLAVMKAFVTDAWQPPPYP